MTLHLTPDMLAASYDFLRTTPPFRRWKLPDSSGVVFRVVRNPELRGHYRRDRCNRPEIAVSGASVGHTCNLIETMAHEMIHLYEDLAGATTSAMHNAFFRRAAAQVCKVHGFDPKMFV